MYVIFHLAYLIHNNKSKCKSIYVWEAQYSITMVTETELRDDGLGKI